MVNIYRLIIAVFIFSSSSAFAIVPDVIEYRAMIPGFYSNWQFSTQSACADSYAKFSAVNNYTPGPRSELVNPGVNGARCEMRKGNYINWHNTQYSLYESRSSCPANSTLLSGSCVCDSGTEEKDGQCAVPITDLQRCKELNNWFDSTFNPNKSREVPGKLPYDDSLVCVSPDKEGLGPLGDPAKGCLFKFDRSMAWQKDGNWTSFGEMSTLEPQLCNIGDPPPEEDPNNCPVGWKKSSNGDYCVPEQDNPITCPPGMKESSFVPGLCIPVDVDPDPYNPNPPKPVDPDPTNPNPTDPGPGDQCPAGRVKNADGKCELVSGPGPAPVDPDPNNPNPTDPAPGEPCPVGRVKNEDGKCEKIPVDPDPGECEPDVLWPEKCLPCEKAALNPNVCKEDPGECEPDPAIPDKCGPGDDDDNGKFGGSCAAGFTCSGDVIQCAIAKEQHMRACKLFDDKNPESELYESEKDKKGNQSKDLEGNDDVDMSNRIKRDNLLGGSGGVKDLSITVMGQSISLPFSKINSGLDALGRVLVAVSLLIALKIIGRG